MLYAKHVIVTILTSFFVITLFTSYLPKKKSHDHKVAKNHLKVAGAFNYDVLGNIYFEESKEINSQGLKKASLTLKLESKTNTNFAILLASINEQKPISTGTYTMKAHGSENMDYSEGVFGYFNNTSSKELPFYTQNGQVIVTKKSEKLVEGFMELELTNAHQKRITVRGNFVATKHQ